MADATLTGNGVLPKEGMSIGDLQALRLPFPARRRFLGAFAAWVRAAHASGQRLASASMEVEIDAGGEWRFSTADRLPVPGRSLGEQERWRDLAALYADLLPDAGRSESLRFLHAYLPPADGADRRRIMRAIETRALRLAARRWRSQSRYALGNAGEFRRQQVGAFRVYRRATAEAEAALAALLPDPDRLLAQGEVLFGRGNSCTAVKVVLAGRPYILKKYHCRGWGYRLRHLVRRSRAVRNWLAAWRLRLRGVPLAAACVCLDERRWGLLGRSYILTEHFDGLRLSDLYPQASRSVRRGLLAQMAVLFGRLHRFGAIHGDTNWDNILLRPEGERFATVLVDLDGSRILPWRRPKRAAKDIWHFIRDLKRRGGDDRSEIDFFLRCWVRWSGSRSALPEIDK